MTTSTKANKLKRHRVTFRLASSTAKEVFLAGDFNDWNHSSHPMKKNGNGSWSRTVMIPAGRYEYKFLADGEWMEDDSNHQNCRNIFGTLNSVLDLRSK